MPVVFVFVIGVVVGFGLALVWQRILKDSENAQKARINRKEAAEKTTNKSKNRR